MSDFLGSLDPRWEPEPGEQVAEIDLRAFDPRCRISVVDRLTKTQVVLTSGVKYRRSNLTQIGEARGTWSSPTKLYPLSAPEVKRTMARRILRNLRRKLDDILNGSVAANGAEAQSVMEDLSRAISDAYAKAKRWR